ncbi:MAG: hypothetical protein WAT81_03940 [Candidatus Moraniibacteriota bacterium]
MESKSEVLKRINDGFPAYWESLVQQLRYRALKREDIPELLALVVNKTVIPPDELPSSVKAEIQATFRSSNGEIFSFPGRFWSLDADSFGVRFTSPQQAERLTIFEEIMEYAFFGPPGIDATIWNDQPD